MHDVVTTTAVQLNYLRELGPIRATREAEQIALKRGQAWIGFTQTHIADIYLTLQGEP